jgi:CRP/FNR family cyclic AMP-dependent transcriptional regulator
LHLFCASNDPMTAPVLEILDDDERRAILGVAVRRSFERGQTVFRAGDPADSVHLVEVGHLAVRVSTPNGDVATLNILGPGSWFGELSLLRDQARSTRSATVISIDAAETLVLTRASFHALCATYPRIERLVVALMATRIRELGSDVLDARYAPLELRVSRSLLKLADLYDADGGRPVIPLTQEDLAGLVGGARPRVNEVLQRLAAEGIVELGRGKVAVLDRARLSLEANL